MLRAEVLKLFHKFIKIINPIFPQIQNVLSCDCTIIFDIDFKEFL